MSSKLLGPNIGDIEIRLLRVFRAVVDRGGLTAAQVELGLGLATISKHLSDLETRLGMRLCTRGHEKFRLTEQGELLYRASLELFGSIDHLRQQVGGARREMVAEISLGVVDGVVTDASTPVIRAIGELRRRAPLVRLRVVVSSPDEIEVGLLNQRLSLGVVPAYRQLPGLQYTPLYEEVSDLFCAAGHPFHGRADDSIEPNELPQQAFVGRGYVDSPTKLRIMQDLTSSATAWQVEGAAMLVLSGAYLGYLPIHYAAQWVRTGQMRPLFNGSMRYATPFCLVWRRGLKLTRPVELVIDLLQRGG
jgi:DNA-binding transcriptional LysR family regulator